MEGCALGPLEAALWRKDLQLMARVYPIFLSRGIPPGGEAVLIEALLAGDGVAALDGRDQIWRKSSDRDFLDRALKAE